MGNFEGIQCKDIDELKGQVAQIMKQVEEITTTTASFKAMSTEFAGYCGKNLDKLIEVLKTTEVMTSELQEKAKTAEKMMMTYVDYINEVQNIDTSLE